MTENFETLRGWIQTIHKISRWSPNPSANVDEWCLQHELARGCQQVFKFPPSHPILILLNLACEEYIPVHFLSISHCTRSTHTRVNIHRLLREFMLVLLVYRALELQQQTLLDLHFPIFRIFFFKPRLFIISLIPGLMVYANVYRVYRSGDVDLR